MARKWGIEPPTAERRTAQDRRAGRGGGRRIDDHTAAAVERFNRLQRSWEAPPQHRGDGGTHA
jgi:hypothetical protein